ncbi:MAG TPA: acetyl-CoA C-acetyltransferase [Solirubrobacteraceae bacterium]|nr:acetyl-CoA C-acetyltransferase [Solirubrobacteraceae bacterium]
MTQPIAILGGNRIPFARSNGPYAEASNQDMLTAALDGLVARFSLQGERAGEVVAGAVLKHPRDFNLTREAVLGSALDKRTPAYDVQQACDTGLQAALAVAGKIALGTIEWGIAGGVDTTSDAPIGVNEDLRRVLLEANRRKGIARVRLLGHLRPGHIVPSIPRNAEPRTGLSMGEHQAITTDRFSITREAQDELAVASHQALAAAYERGFLDDLVTPYLGLERDQNLRPDTSTDKLAKLKPVFGDTMTAGNSTPLSDGAALVLLANETWADERKLPVLAHLTHAETAAVDYVNGASDSGGEREARDSGLLMAPVDAAPRLLERAGLSLQDFDFYEIHEAFAAQVLCTLKAWEENGLGAIDRAKLNVAGGSLAAGHPFAATGGRILASTAKLLAERGSGRALISICAAGGQGVVAIVERPA